MLVTCTWLGKWITAMWLDIWISNQWEVTTKLKLFNCNWNNVGTLLHFIQYYYYSYCSNVERHYSNIIACSQQTHMWTEVVAGVLRDWMLRQNPSGGWKNGVNIQFIITANKAAAKTPGDISSCLLWLKYLKPNLWCFPERDQRISYLKTHNIQFGLQKHACQTFFLEIGSHKQNLVGIWKRSGLASWRLVQNTLHVLT